jgi:hypothetical protein
MGEKEISTQRSSLSLKLPAQPENPCELFISGFWERELPLPRDY